MAISKVTSGGIADGTLSVEDIADDAVTAAKLANSINTDIATGVTGNTTANAALPKAGGTMTGNIAHAGTLTLDAGSNVHIDADGSSVVFLDGGTHMGTLKMANSNINLDSQVVDKDIIFSGNDGGSAITALTLDMSNGGQAVFSKGATFNDHVYFQDNDKAVFGGGDDLQIYHDGSHSRIKDMGTGHLVLSGGEIHFNNSANTVNRMIINSAGIVTMPYQPAFMASTDGFVASTTAYNDLMVMAIEALDVGNNFSLSTSRFTAPIAGVYMLHGTIEFENGNASDWKGANFMINGSTLAHDFNGGNMVSGSNSGDTVSYIVSLSAGDYVSLVADSWNGTYNYRASFGGHLIG